MLKVTAVLTLLLTFTTLCRGQSNDFYTAAVVEYYPIQNTSASIDDKLNGNVAEYVKILSEINEDLDIIVYPEATITTGSYGTDPDFYVQLATEVPAADENIAPCNSEYPQFFKTLSCAASQYNTYLAVNVIEKEICTEETQERLGDNRPCASYGYNLYNTDVAFDRSGRVISRYRKFNLFGEFEKNTTLKPDISIFTTDFNVTFGMFTCFDILFETPALEIIRQGIRNIIFPTMWFSELPFLTALQVQEMFSVSTNVNLLASGANNPRLGSGGSGIYQGKHGPLVFDVIENAGTKAYIYKVGKTPEVLLDDVFEDAWQINAVSAKEMDDFELIRDQVDAYTTILLNTAAENTVETLCHEEDEENKICCFFNITVTRDSIKETNDYYKYRLAAYTGVRSYSGVYNGGVELCGIIFCQNTTQSSCGYRFTNYSTVSWPTTFENIQIVSNFTNVHTKMQYPNSLLSSIRPIFPNFTEWSSVEYENDGLIERKFDLKKPQGQLLTFAIYGRDFSRDSDPFASSAVSLHSTTIFCLFFCVHFLVKFLFNELKC